jgi:aspartokinase
VDRQLEALESDSEGRLFEQLKNSRAPLRFHTDQEILIDRRNWHDREAFSFPKGARSKGLVCEVSAVGLGVGTDCEILQNASQTLKDAGIAWTHRRSSPDSLHWRVAEEDSIRAQRVLHRFLVTPSSKKSSN